MTRGIIVCSAAVAMAFGAGVMMPKVEAQTGVTAKNILQSDMKGGLADETLMQVVEFPANATLPWHMHPDGHEIAYVLEGSAILEIEGQESRTVKAGEGIHVNPNIVHRGRTEASPAKLLVVRVKPKDKPIMVPVQR
jgi:quercetin dioxygenase-like cupin family protein